jgi:hypothetical protein
VRQRERQCVCERGSEAEREKTETGSVAHALRPDCTAASGLERWLEQLTAHSEVDRGELAAVEQLVTEANKKTSYVHCDTLSQVTEQLCGRDDEEINQVIPGVGVQQATHLCTAAAAYGDA